MLSLLIIIVAAGLVLQAFIGLTFLISSIWEKERRASVFGSLQFLGMLALVLLFFYLLKAGFFETPAGIIILIIGLLIGAIGAFGLIRRIGEKCQSFGRCQRADRRRSEPSG